MDSKVLRILEYLEPYGLQNKADIRDLINHIFPVPPSDIESHFNSQRNLVYRFLEEINKIDPPYQPKNGYIKLNDGALNALKQFRDAPDTWFDWLQASITDYGIEALTKVRQREVQQTLGLSVIDVNNSVIDTNQSVRTTNANMLTISTNQQTTLNRQTFIFLFTGIFALGALIVSVIGIIKDNSKEQLSKQLQDTAKVTSTLRHQLSQLRNKLHRDSMAMKTLPKKKKA